MRAEDTFIWKDGAPMNSLEDIHRPAKGLTERKGNRSQAGNRVQARTMKIQPRIFVAELLGSAEE